MNLHIYVETQSTNQFMCCLAISCRARHSWVASQFPAELGNFTSLNLGIKAAEMSEEGRSSLTSIRNRSQQDEARCSSCPRRWVLKHYYLPWMNISLTIPLPSRLCRRLPRVLWLLWSSWPWWELHVGAWHWVHIRVRWPPPDRNSWAFVHPLLWHWHQVQAEPDCDSFWQDRPSHQGCPLCQSQRGKPYDRWE